MSDHVLPPGRPRPRRRGQHPEPDGAVLACRVADPDPWCHRCVRHSVTRQLAHEPNDFFDIDQIRARLAAFAVRYNAVATPLDWRFTEPDLETYSGGSTPTRTQIKDHRLAARPPQQNLRARPLRRPNPVSWLITAAIRLELVLELVSNP